MSFRRLCGLALFAPLGCAPRPEPAAPANVAVTEAGPDAQVTEQSEREASCDEDPQAEPGKPRPSGPRPFVHVIPREEVPLTRSVPDRDVTHGSVVCKRGREVWRDEAGRLRVCTIARPVTLHGIEIPADAYTHFHEDGRPFQTQLARARDLVTEKGMSVPCAAELVVLSKTGALEHCKLARAVSIGGVACRGGESIAFHSGGQLAAAVVERATKVLDAELPAGTRVRWFESGRVAGVWVQEPVRFSGVLVRWDVDLHENGRLRAFDIAEKTTIAGHELPERAKIELRADGSLKRAEYEVDRGFMPHGEMWTDTKHVTYDCHGKITSEHVEHWQADRPPPRRR